MCKIVTIGTEVFTTQTAAEKHIRCLIQNLGICSSVKDANKKSYETIYELCKRHPDSTNKMKDIADFKIVKNKLNSKAYELHICRIDGSTTDISWKVCITGRAKTYKNDLFSAFRVSISDQIQEFRLMNDTLKCVLCNKKNIKTHVDHVIHFQKIVEDFLQVYNGSYSKSFDTIDDNTNRCCFTQADTDIKQMFQEYHKNNASLRILCEECNLKRKKFKLQ